MADDWRDDLTEWLRPFVATLGDRRRARMCPAYVEGLIGPGDRKSVQPMAMRSPGIGYDQLHHFIGAALWNSAPLEKELCRQADALVGSSDAWLIIDDTTLPKKKRTSVGLALRRTCSSFEAYQPSSAPTMARSSSPWPFGTGSAPSVQKRLTSSPDRPGRMVIARALTPASAMKC